MLFFSPWYTADDLRLWVNIEYLVRNFSDKDAESFPLQLDVSFIALYEMHCSEYHIFKKIDRYKKITKHWFFRIIISPFSLKIDTAIHHFLENLKFSCIQEIQMYKFILISNSIGNRILFLSPKMFWLIM